METFVCGSDSSDSRKKIPGRFRLSDCFHGASHWEQSTSRLETNFVDSGGGRVFIYSRRVPMYSNAISRVRWRFFPVGKEPTRSLPRFPCRSVSSLIFKTMHKRDPLPDTVCMHLYGFGATSFRSASQEPMYSARNGNLLACGRVKLPATRTHSRYTREGPGCACT